MKIYDCPLECPCDDVRVCMECDYYSFQAEKLEKAKKKCYNGSNKDKDEVSPNQSYQKTF